MEKSVESVENLFFHSFSRPSHSRNVQNSRLYFIIKPPLFQSFQQHFEGAIYNSITARRTAPGQRLSPAGRPPPAEPLRDGFRLPGGEEYPLTQPQKRGFRSQKTATNPPAFPKKSGSSPSCTKARRTLALRLADLPPPNRELSRQSPESPGAEASARAGRKRNRGRIPRFCTNRARDAIKLLGRFFGKGQTGSSPGKAWESPGVETSARAGRKRNRGRIPRPSPNRARDAIKIFGKPFFQKRFVVQ